VSNLQRVSVPASREVANKGTSVLTPTVLIGPADLRTRQTLIAVLSKHAIVECIDRRDTFRRALRKPKFDVVVLYSRDQDGVPNEPLLAQANESMPRRPVVQILSGTGVRLPVVDGANRRSDVFHYLLPAEPTQNHLEHLSGLILELARRRSPAAASGHE